MVLGHYKSINTGLFLHIARANISTWRIVIPMLRSNNFSISIDSKALFFLLTVKKIGNNYTFYRKRDVVKNTITN